MSTMPVSLVEDPLLRASLRRLYPELPSWAQRWVIATPGKPLPPPPEYHHAAWGGLAAAQQALRDTLAALQAESPQEGWRIAVKEAGGRTIAEIRSRQQDQVVPHAPGRLLRYECWGAELEDLTFSDPGGRLELAEWKTPFVDWSLICGGEGVGYGVVNLDSRHVNRGLGRRGHIILADGTVDRLTMTRGVIDAAQEQSVPRWMRIDGWEAHDVGNLAARWRALESAADRARITAFWLGHHCPVLATAGLATLGVGHRLQR